MCLPVRNIIIVMRKQVSFAVLPYCAVYKGASFKEHRTGYQYVCLLGRTYLKMKAFKNIYILKFFHFRYLENRFSYVILTYFDAWKTVFLKNMLHFKMKKMHFSETK